MYQSLPLAVVIGLLLALVVQLGARGRVDLPPVGTLVLGVIAAAVGDQLGFTLLARSTASGWLQPQSLVGAAVVSAVVLVVWARWSFTLARGPVVPARAASARVEKSRRSSTRTAPTWLVVALVVWRSRNRPS